MMDSKQLRYDMIVIHRAYRSIGRYPMFCLTLFVLIILFAASLFLILIHEPVSDWHEDKFVLERVELRATGKSGYVADVYAVDGRRFVINKNEKEIMELLEVGREYRVIYSEDFFHNIIQSLSDEKIEYLNLESSRRSSSISFWVLYIMFFLSGGLLLTFNALFAFRNVQRERMRMKRFKNHKS